MIWESIPHNSTYDPLGQDCSTKDAQQQVLMVGAKKVCKSQKRHQKRNAKRPSKPLNKASILIIIILSCGTHFPVVKDRGQVPTQENAPNQPEQPEAQAPANLAQSLWESYSTVT